VFYRSQIQLHEADFTSFCMDSLASLQWKVSSLITFFK
jgi:hypothetical protein